MLLRWAAWRDVQPPHQVFNTIHTDMKRYQAIACGLCCMMLSALPMEAVAASKQDAHIAYVLKNVTLKKEEVAKLRPLLVQYYEEIARVKAPRKALRDKYQKAEDAGKLTAQQCDELFESKQKQESGELEVRRRYYAKFKTVLSTPKAYEVIKLCNDKVK